MDSLEGKLLFIIGEKGSGKTSTIQTIINKYNSHKPIWDIEGELSLVLYPRDTLLVVDCYFDLLREELVQKHTQRIRDFLRGTNNICVVANRQNRLKEGVDISIEL